MVTTSCHLCKSSDLSSIIDLGHHPLADMFLSSDQLKQSEARYPLYVVQCQLCGHVMLGYVVPPTLRYQTYEYSYTASNSPVSLAHFRELAELGIKRANVTSTDLVVDIGSNDGTLLSLFRQMSKCNIFGVDPSPNMASLADQKLVPNIPDFFNSDAASLIIKNHGQAKLIVSTNTFNHVGDLHDFIEQICKLLSRDGLFIFEVPYLSTLVEQKAFDTIYLEHISYFALRPFSKFFEQYGLSIIDAEPIEYMGGSIRVTVGFTDNHHDKKDLQRLYDYEDKLQLYSAVTYEQFMVDISRLKLNLVAQLIEAKKNGAKVVGIGAATKGNTLLNYCNIDGSLIDFIADASPLKIGKYTPGSHIPIKSDDDLNEAYTHAVILPWNIATFLKQKLQHHNFVFITPNIK
jgi:SAM-dependent methyltransferase